MPKIERWDNLPAGVRRQLIDRMRERAIRIVQSTFRRPGVMRVEV